MIGGLRPLPKDPRDVKVGAVFKKLPLPEEDFEVEIEWLKDQKNTDLCGAYAGTSASEPQEGIELDPNYQFAKIKQIEGRWDTWGANLRDVCKSLVKFGSIPYEDSPFTDKSRDFVADWTNWDSKFDTKALKHRKRGYLTVRGWRDAFDDIRAVLWANRGIKAVALVGALWRNEWSNSDGVIPEEYGDGGFGHALVFKGQKTINGEPHLIAHLSNGNIGDNGMFYFPREVVNKEIAPYGAYYFVDMDSEEVKRYWSIWQIIYNFFRKIYGYLIH